LVRFAAAFRKAGLVAPDGEWPDFVPAVLDLASVDPDGWRLLREHRVGVDLLAHALAAAGSPYRYAIDAVTAMLPAPAPAELAAAAGLARTGPPGEEVGLEPYPQLGGRR
jgi:nitrate reductase delta subunit